MDQWVCLTEERNAVMVPSPGSGIPGAPADWYVLKILNFVDKATQKNKYSLNPVCVKNL